MMTPEHITNTVNAVYSERARNGSDTVYSTTVASAVGYTPDQLASIPTSSNLGLSCGNPVAIAGLRPGETVLDLGCGGGLDVFLAADQVGLTGIAIGLDGSEDMVDLARRNASAKGVKAPHVAFAQASLTTELPIESSSVDCILSNCVLNLLPESGKASILKEAHRVLKPEGRIHLSDIVAIKDIPDEIRKDLSLYVNCVSGAISKAQYEDLLHEAGFQEFSLVDTGVDLDAYYLYSPQQQQQQSCCAPKLPALGGAEAKPSFKANDFVGAFLGLLKYLVSSSTNVTASYEIYAQKSPSPSEIISSTVLKNWWDAYPTVKSSPEAITAEQVAALIRDPTKNPKDFVVVDVRRNDHAGGHVRGSSQCPAQTFYDDALSYFERFKDSERVIFYCQSSNGRGPRCAGWYQDYLDSVSHASSKAYVLSGGIKGWMAKYRDQTDLIDYD
ncbi:S-adenosyl-L-methionine-dependent methyltransferase [Macrolepiota fuliginosa MF-IS2]|uniref:Arsenite methyltransferase n=1 Tax=Macrolepiota fuliginosa MF-IS2 TaxID=1400762 RepID=A0A9P5XD52_9AGAR|nr:S-adenosyl-L-methionine-dependent methyltransferase [Macrolepiota fuliginosa MF-IS2]